MELEQEYHLEIDPGQPDSQEYRGLSFGEYRDPGRGGSNLAEVARELAKADERRQSAAQAREGSQVGWLQWVKRLFGLPLRE